MRLRLTFEITLRSDYHVGAGRRAGPGVDSALLRDHRRTLILPGTMLAGLLRDGLEDLLELEPAAKIKAWVERADGGGAKERLFGSVAQRKRWAYSTARPINTLEGEATRQGSQDVTRVRISPRTRRSEPQKLFGQEEGDARLKFQFTATCEGALERDIADATLLVAAARMVRHLGASRRRGRGECELTLVAAEGLPAPADGEAWTDKALSEFKMRWLDAAQPPAANSLVSPGPALSLAREPLRFRIVACAEEPVIVAWRSEAANAYESLSFIPGLTVLGALATRATQALALDPQNDTPADFVTLFLRGGVRVSGLLPAVVQEGKLYPAVPAPLSLFRCENSPGFGHHGPFDALADLPQDCPTCHAKLETLDGFWSLSAQPGQVKPLLREQAHIRMNRATGRVKRGDLYEYVALEAEQWFVGELDCANQDCWERLKALTDLAEDTLCELRVGKASRRGYGLVRLLVQPLTGDESPWTQRSMSERVKAVNDVRVMLLTDAIVPDSWGRFYTGFDKAWVAEMLGLKPEQVQVKSQAVGIRSVDSFNTYRRMPRWRDEAIAAGSVALVHIGQVELEALQDKLKQVEAEGIGLRRHEGFGRVAFNHPLFAPADDLTGIDLATLPPDIRPPVSQAEQPADTLFRVAWASTLDKSQHEQGSRWQEVAHEALARLVFLCRRETPTQLRHRLENIGRPEYLWDKRIQVRDKEPLIGSGQIILDLIGKLEQQAAGSNWKWETGLTMLAERIEMAAVKRSREEGR
jgi:CRISPR-associated protein Csx10